ncbi:MAG: ectoine/hydroxyectoine ABC transporter permease subunit EhuD [Nitriliruptoraceae bacterium]|nr:ectoine/hydroxyectoine ABC transporter permease subunit EhuD [Nitriliruptoraceae bacterium]
MSVDPRMTDPVSTDAPRTPATGRRIGGIPVTIGGVGAVVFSLAALFVVWRFGGGSVRFEIRETRDPSVAFDWGFVWAYTPDFLRALWVLIQATVGGFALAIVIGLVLALLRRAPVKLLSMPTAFFIEFVRSTPLLVQLFFLFFGLPRIGWIPESLRVWSSLATLIIALGFHYGAYCSEAYRAGIDSVPKGQWEAATALNLGTLATWAQVVLPQAIPNVLPALGNFLIASFKDAPLGASINVTCVLFFADTTASRTFASVELYTMLGLGFLAVSLPAAFLLRRLERRIGYERT